MLKSYDTFAISKDGISLELSSYHYSLTNAVHLLSPFFFLLFLSLSPLTMKR